MPTAKNAPAASGKSDRIVMKEMSIATAKNVSAGMLLGLIIVVCSVGGGGEAALHQMYEHAYIAPLLWCIATAAASLLIVFSSHKHKHVTRFFAEPILRFCSHAMGVACGMLPLLAARLASLNKLHQDPVAIGIMFVMTLLLAVMAACGIAIDKHEKEANGFATALALFLFVVSLAGCAVFSATPSDVPHTLNGMAKELRTFFGVH